MRTIAMVVACGLAACGLAGCCSWGYRFEVQKVPHMFVQTPVLLQPGSTNPNGAHPMGSAAGPVTDGQFNAGPAVAPGPQQPQKMPAGPARATSNSISQPQPGPTYITPAPCPPRPPASSCGSPCAAQQTERLPGVE